MLYGVEEGVLWMTLQGNCLNHRVLLILIPLLTKARFNLRVADNVSHPIHP